MAYRRKRILRRKRTFKRKPRTRKPRGTKIVSSLGFPERMTFKHKYVELLGQNIVAGTPFIYKFSCNGLYDPNITGTGNQPYYHDQVSALYNHYFVTNSTIKVNLTNNGLSVPVVWTIFVEDDTTGPTTVRNAMEKGHKTRIAGYDRANSKLSKSWSATKAFPHNQQNELSALVGANPAEQQYFYIMADSIDGAQNGALYLTVELFYTTQWYELKSVGSS